MTRTKGFGKFLIDLIIQELAMQFVKENQNAGREMEIPIQKSS